MFELILVFRSTKLGIEQYKAFLEELAKSKKIDLAEMKKKMANCGPPGVTSGAGGVSITHKHTPVEVCSAFHNLLLNYETLIHDKYRAWPVS